MLYLQNYTDKTRQKKVNVHLPRTYVDENLSELGRMHISTGLLSGAISDLEVHLLNQG